MNTVNIDAEVSFQQLIDALGRVSIYLNEHEIHPEDIHRLQLIIDMLNKKFPHKE